MKEERIALIKAINSGDTDLVYHVLLHLRSTLSPGDFFHLLDDAASPELAPAVKLLQVYARQGDRQLLRDFYYQDDRRTENACLEMEEAYEARVSVISLSKSLWPGRGLNGKVGWPALGQEKRKVTYITDSRTPTTASNTSGTHQHTLPSTKTAPSRRNKPMTRTVFCRCK